MRQTSAVVHGQHHQFFPSGWLILGAALTSWALVAALWIGASQLFQLILSFV